MPDDWMVEARVGQGFVGKTKEVSGLGFEGKGWAEHIEACVEGSAEPGWRGS